MRSLQSGRPPVHVLTRSAFPEWRIAWVRFPPRPKTRTVTLIPNARAGDEAMQYAGMVQAAIPSDAVAVAMPDARA
jgi:hypothetical protein